MIRKNKVILFDIDFVLIDSQKLREISKEKICLNCQISPEKFNQIYESYYQQLNKTSDFSPLKFASFIGKELNRPVLTKKVKKIYLEDEESYQQSLYNDVLPAFKKLSTDSQLGIYSEGVQEFQSLKINLSGIKKYIKNELIFIMSDKTEQGEAVLQKIRKPFVVDDNPKHVREIIKHQKAIPLWLKRGPKAERVEKLDCSTIYSLLDLVDFFKKN